MPDRQDVEVVSGKKLGFPQGLTDQLRLGRKHYFGDAHLLERFVLLSLIQSRQNDQFISGDLSSHLLPAVAPGGSRIDTLPLGCKEIVPHR